MIGTNASYETQVPKQDYGTPLAFLDVFETEVSPAMRDGKAAAAGEDLEDRVAEMERRDLPIVSPSVAGERSGPKSSGNLGEPLPAIPIEAEPTQAKEPLCIGCNRVPEFCFFLIVTTKGKTPRQRKNTQATYVCSRCASPQSPEYQKIKVILGAILFGLVNELSGEKL